MAFEEAVHRQLDLQGLAVNGVASRAVFEGEGRIRSIGVAPTSFRCRC